MKALSLLLAAVSGAGFLFHNQVQTWVSSMRLGSQNLSSHHLAPEGVYYMRTALPFITPQGPKQWTPGQELRMVPQTASIDGALPLTDGTHTVEVAETDVTRDMDDASALRQMSASNANAAQARIEQEAANQRQLAENARSNRIVSGQFHRTNLDEPSRPTYRPDYVVSTASAPVIYYPGYNNTIIINRTVQSNAPTSRTVVVPQNASRPASNPPPPVVRGY